MAEELSLVISNPGEGEFLKKIDWNKEDFMELVSSVTKQYAGVMYSEDQMKDAKADRAKLNAMKKAISDRRIEVKNAIMAPCNQFEKEVKEVVSLIDEPIALIDSQIKEYEERCKAEKRKNLEEYFVEIADELEGMLTFDMIFDQKWLNASVSLKKAKGEIEAKINGIKTDLRSIESLCDEKYQPMLKDYYMRCLNITATMSECSRLREIDRREAERKEREAEEARLKAEQQTVVSETTESVAETAKTVSETAESVSESFESATEPVSDMGKVIQAIERQAYETAVTEPFVQEEDAKQYKASFTIFGTKAQIMGVKQYMIENNIRFGKVEK